MNSDRQALLATIKAVCGYVEAHRREYGVALFVIPALLLACALLGAGYLLAWVLQ